MVQHAQGALEERDILGQVKKSGRTGFGLGDSGKAWGNAELLERSQMATSFVRQQEEETR